jgi:hypothetical protein
MMERHEREVDVEKYTCVRARSDYDLSPRDVK